MSFSGTMSAKGQHVNQKITFPEDVHRLLNAAAVRCGRHLISEVSIRLHDHIQRHPEMCFGQYKGKDDPRKKYKSVVARNEKETHQQLKMLAGRDGLNLMQESRVRVLDHIRRYKYVACVGHVIDRELEACAVE